VSFPIILTITQERNKKKALQKETEKWNFKLYRFQLLFIEI